VCVVGELSVLCIIATCVRIGGKRDQTANTRQHKENTRQLKIGERERSKKREKREAQRE
jgi:hypothetical protein